MITGLYQHHRGGWYLGLFLAWESTNGRKREPVVVYFSLRKLIFNVRDAREFFQNTIWDENPKLSGPIRFIRVFPWWQPRGWKARSLGGSI